MTRSYSCELPQTPNASHATTRSSIASTMSSSSQLSHPSPTPSSASSSSNSLSMHSDGVPGQFLHRPHRPKFGQSSPNQLKKLLALSDGAVIVPHSNSASTNNSHHNNNTNNGGGSNLSTGHVNSGGGLHHGAHHHPSLYSQHNMTRSSNSSLNSSVSGSTSYYNGFNSHNHNYGPNGYSNTTNYSSGYVTTNNGGGLKLSYTSHTSHQSYMSNPPSHASAGPTPACCCTSQSAGPLFPNQSYCSCFNRSMRPMLMIPQTSGLMHSSCPSCQPSQQSSRRSTTIPFKQPLPVESSSVTSMRKLEEFQQMTRYREQARFASKQSGASNNSRRPQCPDYDTAMQRLCNAGMIKANGGAGSSGKNILYSHRSRSSSRQHHHREDAV